MSLQSPQCYEMRTVAEDEVVQQVRVETGKGPADSAAPVVANQGELGDAQPLHEALDVVRQLLDMILLQLPRFLALSVAPVVDGDHSKVLFKVFDLMSPDKPELREAVTEQHDGLPLVLLCVEPGLHIVEPHTVDLDVVMAPVLRVQQTGGGNSAVLHLEQSQSDQQEPEAEPDQAREEEEGPDTNTHNAG